MDFRMATYRLATLSLCAFLAATLSAQRQGEAERQQTPEEVAAVRAAIVDALDRKLLSEDRDELYVLAMRHSRIIVPELVARMEAALDDQGSADGKLVARLADILAYAADELAVDALSRFCAQDEKRFGYFVERVLHYSEARRNPYTLAYHALEKGRPEMNPYVMRWVRVGLSSPHYQRLWAQALFNRHKAIPTESKLQQDPLVSRLSDGVPPELRSALIIVANEAAALR